MLWAWRTVQRSGEGSEAFAKAIVLGPLAWFVGGATIALAVLLR
jgi:hypothetical protein